MLAGAGVDVDTVTGKPGEKLWFGLHGWRAGRGATHGANHFAWSRSVVGPSWGVLLALLTNTPALTMLDSLADYPRWLVALCVTVVLAAVIWIALKILKWTLWLLLFTVLIVGLGTALWLVLR